MKDYMMGPKLHRVRSRVFNLSFSLVHLNCEPSPLPPNPGLGVFSIFIYLFIKHFLSIYCVPEATPALKLKGFVCSELD